MNKYELEQSIDKMEIVIKLLSRHIPERYANRTLIEALNAKIEMELQLKTNDKNIS